MKSTLLFTLFFSITFFGFAQKNTIAGTIYDEDNNVLADANVIVKNATKGTITDKNGQFTIEMEATDILEISYLGFETKEVIVGDQKEITIILKSEWEKLEAVEVTAIGINCRKIMTFHCEFGLKNEYIIQEEKSKEFKRIPNDESLTSLFPNPSASGLFQLKLDKTYNTLTVEVFNMNGQLIKTKTYSKLSKIPQIDLSTQPKGIYLIRTIADGKVLETKKAIRS